MSEEMKKPDWFELADSDAASTQVTKVNKKLPIAAILIAGAVIATGALFASASENDASAEGISSTVAAPSATSGSTPAAIPSATPSSDPAAASAKTPGIQDPTQGGISAPGATRGDDDGDRHRGDREGDHEGREGHQERD